MLGVSVPGLPSAPSESPSRRPLTTGEQVDITDPGSVAERLDEAISELATSIIEQVPLILLGTVVFVLGLVIVGLLQRGVVHATNARRADPAVARLIQVMTRIVLVLLVALLALSVAGVDIGSALAALGLAGLAVAFAVQSILENFIAGILILIRRPFRPGDQVRLGDYEGTVTDVNMRVTTLLQFDGEKVLLPNALVFNEPITNTTELGRRRSEAVVGVDYRNDHDRARALLLETLHTVDGVLPTPAPRVLLSELNESSVDFRLLFWTLPEQAEVNGVRDRVLGAAKSAVEEAGMTIPWPIRTLVLDESSREFLRGTAQRDRGGRAPARRPTRGRPGVTAPSRWSPDPVHVAVDLSLFTVVDGRLRVLLHRRPYDPAAGRWAVPGSFTRPGESLGDTARRALHDKAGLDDVWLEQLMTYDQRTEPGATRVVSVVQLALLDAARATPAGEADWWPVDELPTPLAFGHDRFVADGVARLRAKARYAPLAFQLLGDDFTLAELQVVYEAVLGDELDVRNFRRDVRASGTVEETGEVRRAGPGRPAKLYRHTPGEFAVDGGERRTARLIAGRSGERDAEQG